MFIIQVIADALFRHCSPITPKLTQSHRGECLGVIFAILKYGMECVLQLQLI
jgi:hypothetical protein